MRSPPGLCLEIVVIVFLAVVGRIAVAAILLVLFFVIAVIVLVFLILFFILVIIVFRHFAFLLINFCYRNSMSCTDIKYSSSFIGL